VYNLWQDFSDLETCDCVLLYKGCGDSRVFVAVEGLRACEQYDERSRETIEAQMELKKNSVMNESIVL
jgi:hypothetical protein